MSRQMRNGVPAIEPDVWYVSYCSKIGPKPVSEKAIVRATQRFKSEAEAKQFAQKIIGEGWSAIAGTINPYKPKKAISSRQILKWVGDTE